MLKTAQFMSTGSVDWMKTQGLPAATINALYTHSIESVSIIDSLGPVTDRLKPRVVLLVTEDTWTLVVTSSPVDLQCATH